MKKFILFFVVAISFSFKVFAITSLPDMLLKCPVFITLDNGSTGSGFLINDDRKIYLVSAKHVFYKDATNLSAKSTTFKIYSTAIGFQDQMDVTIDLLQMLKDGHILQKNDKDVVAIELGVLQKADSVGNRGIVFNDGLIRSKSLTKPLFSILLSQVKKYSDVIISNDIYILGYPSSLNTTTQLDLTKPLLRKGIVAGLNESTKKIVLDCFVYPGNSGGPVIAINETGIGAFEISVIGVLSQTVPYTEEFTVNREGQPTSTRNTNSGYCIAEPMDDVLDLIKSAKP